MYTLRTITSDGLEYNLALGNFYSVVNKYFNYKVFKEEFKEFFQKDYDQESTEDVNIDSVYAFVIYHENNSPARKIIPLRNYESYYIVTENGQTFSNLTHK